MGCCQSKSASTNTSKSENSNETVHNAIDNNQNNVQLQQFPPSPQSQKGSSDSLSSSNKKEYETKTSNLSISKNNSQTSLDSVASNPTTTKSDTDRNVSQNNNNNTAESQLFNHVEEESEKQVDQTETAVASSQTFCDAQYNNSQSTTISTNIVHVDPLPSTKEQQQPETSTNVHVPSSTPTACADVAQNKTKSSTAPNKPTTPPVLQSIPIKLNKRDVQTVSKAGIESAVTHVNSIVDVVQSFVVVYKITTKAVDQALQKVDAVVESLEAHDHFFAGSGAVVTNSPKELAPVEYVIQKIARKIEQVKKTQPKVENSDAKVDILETTPDEHEHTDISAAEDAGIVVNEESEQQQETQTDPEILPEAVSVDLDSSVGDDGDTVKFPAPVEAAAEDVDVSDTGDITTPQQPQELIISGPEETLPESVQDEIQPQNPDAPAEDTTPVTQELEAVVTISTAESTVEHDAEVIPEDNSVLSEETLTEHQEHSEQSEVSPVTASAEPDVAVDVERNEVDLDDVDSSDVLVPSVENLEVVEYGEMTTLKDAAPDTQDISETLTQGVHSSEEVADAVAQVTDEVAEVQPQENTSEVEFIAAVAQFVESDPVIAADSDAELTISALAPTTTTSATVPAADASEEAALTADDTQTTVAVSPSLPTSQPTPQNEDGDTVYALQLSEIHPVSIEPEELAATELVEDAAVAETAAPTETSDGITVEMNEFVADEDIASSDPPVLESTSDAEEVVTEESLGSEPPVLEAADAQAEIAANVDVAIAAELIEESLTAALESFTTLEAEVENFPTDQDEDIAVTSSVDSATALETTNNSSVIVTEQNLVDAPPVIDLMAGIVLPDIVFTTTAAELRNESDSSGIDNSNSTAVDENTLTNAQDSAIAATATSESTEVTDPELTSADTISQSSANIDMIAEPVVAEPVVLPEMTVENPSALADQPSEEPEEDPSTRESEGFRTFDTIVPFMPSTPVRSLSVDDMRHDADKLRHFQQLGRATVVSSGGSNRPTSGRFGGRGGKAGNQSPSTQSSPKTVLSDSPTPVAPEQTPLVTFEPSADSGNISNSGNDDNNTTPLQTPLQTPLATPTATPTKSPTPRHMLPLPISPISPQVTNIPFSGKLQSNQSGIADVSDTNNTETTTTTSQDNTSAPTSATDKVLATTDENSSKEENTAEGTALTSPADETTEDGEGTSYKSNEHAIPSMGDDRRLYSRSQSADDISHDANKLRHFQQLGRAAVVGTGGGTGSSALLNGRGRGGYRRTSTIGVSTPSRSANTTNVIMSGDASSPDTIDVLTRNSFGHGPSKLKDYMNAINSNNNNHSSSHQK